MAFADRVKKYFGGVMEDVFAEFPPPQKVDDIKAYLLAHMSRRVKLKHGGTLTETTPLADLGMDSLTLINFSGEVEEWLGAEIEPAILFEHSNIADLAVALDNVRRGALPPKP